ncbi:CCD33 protein, partial [Brachypteracias leptosomus]|nr:CCD33 protein [Brachypteracias leptosomus]
LPMAGQHCIPLILQSSRLKAEEKTLDFEFEVVSAQFNQRGHYALRLTVENPLLLGSGAGIQLRINSGEVIQSCTGTTDTIEQGDLNQIYSFQRRKFTFTLPRAGFCKNDKNHDVRLRIEALRFPGRAVRMRRGRQVGEAFFAIYPRTNQPRMKLSAGRDEDWYRYSAVMALLRVGSEQPAMHCGRLAFTASLHEHRAPTTPASPPPTTPASPPLLPTSAQEEDQPAASPTLDIPVPSRSLRTPESAYHSLPTEGHARSPEVGQPRSGGQRTSPLCPTLLRTGRSQSPLGAAGSWPGASYEGWREGWAAKKLINKHIFKVTISLFLYFFPEAAGAAEKQSLGMHEGVPKSEINIVEMIMALFGCFCVFLAKVIPLTGEVLNSRVRGRNWGAKGSPWDVEGGGRVDRDPKAGLSNPFSTSQRLRADAAALSSSPELLDDSADEHPSSSSSSSSVPGPRRPLSRSSFHLSSPRYSPDLASSPAQVTFLTPPSSDALPSLDPSTFKTGEEPGTAPVHPFYCQVRSQESSQRCHTSTLPTASPCQPPKQHMPYLRTAKNWHKSHILTSLPMYGLLGMVGFSHSLVVSIISSIVAMEDPFHTWLHLWSVTALGLEWGQCPSTLLGGASSSALGWQEVSSYRLALKRMAGDLLSLRQHVTSLEVENGHLRQNLASQEELGHALLADDVTRALAATLKRKLVAGTAEMRRLKDRVQQLQNELIRKNDREKDLLLLQRAHRQQQATLRRCQEKVAKTKALEETVRQQEKVIEAMERVLQEKLTWVGRSSEKPAGGTCPSGPPPPPTGEALSGEVYTALLAENRRLREELTRAPQTLPPIVPRPPALPGVLGGREKLSLLAKLEEAQARGRVLERQLEKTARRWGREKQELGNRLLEQEHGF